MHDRLHISRYSNDNPGLRPQELIVPIHSDNWRSESSAMFRCTATLPLPSSLLHQLRLPPNFGGRRPNLPVITVH